MEWEVIESRLRYLLENGRRTELRGALLMLNVVDIAQFMETIVAILKKDEFKDFFKQALALIK